MTTNEIIKDKWFHTRNLTEDKITFQCKEGEPPMTLDIIPPFKQSDKIPQGIQSSIDYIKQICDMERKRFAPANMDGPFIAISGTIKELEVKLKLVFNQVLDETDMCDECLQLGEKHTIHCSKHPATPFIS
jgi:hypothetical protein